MEYGHGHLPPTSHLSSPGYENDHLQKKARMISRRAVLGTLGLAATTFVVSQLLRQTGVSSRENTEFRLPHAPAFGDLYNQDFQSPLGFLDPNRKPELDAWTPSQPQIIYPGTIIINGDNELNIRATPSRTSTNTIHLNQDTQLIIKNPLMQVIALNTGMIYSFGYANPSTPSGSNILWVTYNQDIARQSLVVTDAKSPILPFDPKDWESKIHTASIENTDFLAGLSPVINQWGEVMYSALRMREQSGKIIDAGRIVEVLKV